jgi:hypothetical protein
MAIACRARRQCRRSDGSARSIYHLTPLQTRTRSAVQASHPGGTAFGLDHPRIETLQILPLTSAVALDLNTDPLTPFDPRLARPCVANESPAWSTSMYGFDKPRGRPHGAVLNLINTRAKRRVFLTYRFSLFLPTPLLSASHR